MSLVFRVRDTMRKEFEFRIKLPAISAPPVWLNWLQLFVRTSVSTCNVPPRRFIFPLLTSSTAVCVELVTYKPPPSTVTVPEALLAQLPTTKLDGTVQLPDGTMSEPC